MTPEELYLEAYQELVIEMKAAAKPIARLNAARAKADAAWDFRVSERERAKAVWATPEEWEELENDMTLEELVAAAEAAQEKAWAANNAAWAAWAAWQEAQDLADAARALAKENTECGHLFCAQEKPE